VTPATRQSNEVENGRQAIRNPFEKRAIDDPDCHPCRTKVLLFVGIIIENKSGRNGFERKWDDMSAMSGTGMESSQTAFCSASFSIDRNQSDRWLMPSIDTPVSGRQTIASRVCSSTASRSAPDSKFRFRLHVNSTEVLSSNRKLIAHLLDYPAPVVHYSLAKEARTRVPRRVGAIVHPAPIRQVRQQNPHRAR
jgi:hypothetical protein